MRVSHSAALSDTRLTKRPLGTKLGTVQWGFLQDWRTARRKATVRPVAGRMRGDLLPALEYLGYMLTRSEFVAWLNVRRCAGHSLTVIRKHMGYGYLDAEHAEIGRASCRGRV